MRNSEVVKEIDETMVILADIRCEPQQSLDDEDILVFDEFVSENLPQ
jgi:hypothetical protein